MDTVSQSNSSSNSQNKEPQHIQHSSRVILWVIIIIILLALLLPTLFFFKKSSDTRINIQSRQIPSTPIPSTAPTLAPTISLSYPKVTLQSGKIAFVKNGNLFLLEPSGNKQLTTSGDIGTIKWSPDGNYIAFIRQKKFNSKTNDDKFDYILNTSLSLIESRTNRITEVIKQEYTNEQLQNFLNAQDIYPLPALYGFDFSLDSSKIAYVNQQGVWLKNIVNGQKEKIAENYLSKEDKTLNRYYKDVSWNPQTNILLFHVGAYECGTAELYYVDTKKIEKLTMPACWNYFWSGDGKNVISFNVYGRDEGGLWATDITTKNTKKIIDEKRYGYSVIAAATSKTNQLIASVQPFNSTGTNLPIKGNAIYRVNQNDLLEPLTNNDFVLEYSRLAISLSSDSKKITYLLRTTFPHPDKGMPLYNLQIMDANGRNEGTLLTDISSYAWAP